MFHSNYDEEAFKDVNKLPFLCKSWWTFLCRTLHGFFRFQKLQLLVLDEFLLLPWGWLHSTPGSYFSAVVNVWFKKRNIFCLKELFFIQFLRFWRRDLLVAATSISSPNSNSPPELVNSFLKVQLLFSKEHTYIFNFTFSENSVWKMEKKNSPISYKRSSNTKIVSSNTK